ncbi:MULTISPECIES: hypothetical protein [Prochlorococcus]|uniref:hypothetical protein n=1 Tax=Prochlorococcus TaxID=1218 RepID=UPI000533B1F5|nr:MULTISPECIES: hypothetical protein [Prochlorococcus]KGG12097.1 hypothetical protein EV05_1300 [Prochlorococcus sp. MIT 0601]
MIALVEVNVDDADHIKYLYTLLQNKKFNISHESIPTFEEHIIFVKSCKYRKWYLIKKMNKYHGSVYLTNENTIGINTSSNKYEEYVEIIKLVINNHVPLAPIASIRSKYFIINANPDNSNLIKALKHLKMHHIQSSYAYKTNL